MSSKFPYNLINAHVYVINKSKYFEGKRLAYTTSTHVHTDVDKARKHFDDSVLHENLIESSSGNYSSTAVFYADKKTEDIVKVEMTKHPIMLDVREH